MIFGINQCFNFEAHGLVIRINFLEMPSKIPRCWIPLFSKNQINYATSQVVHGLPTDKRPSIAEKPLKPAIARCFLVSLAAVIRVVTQCFSSVA